MNILLLVAVLLFTFGISVNEATPGCRKGCTREYDPVCGRYRRPNGLVVICNFPNRCSLELHRCQTREPWVGTPGACSQVSPDCERAVRG